jgi:hypothetical protein
MTDPTPFDHLSRNERHRLRAEAPSLAALAARSAVYRANAMPPDAPAARVTDPAACAVIARAYRRLLRDQSDAFVVLRLTEAEALAFPGERHPRDWCTVYKGAALSTVLWGVPLPECVPVLGINIDGDLAIQWAYFGGGTPPDEVILRKARALLRLALERLSDTSIEAFVAGSTVRRRKAGSNPR